MNQRQQVLKHLKQYKTITAQTALDKYGIARLSARIEELRVYHKINTVMVRVKNRFGKTVRVGKYILVA